MGNRPQVIGPIYIALGGNLPSFAGPPRQTQTAALERLIDERQMGTLFKVLAMGPASVAPLPGFVQ